MKEGSAPMVLRKESVKGERSPNEKSNETTNNETRGWRTVTSSGSEPGVRSGEEILRVKGNH